MDKKKLIKDHTQELAEIVREARALTQEEYEEWKEFVRNSATEKTKGITEYMLLIIEQCLKKEQYA